MQASRTLLNRSAGFGGACFGPNVGGTVAVVGDVSLLESCGRLIWRSGG
jgi:hypothetical protein